MGRNRKLLQTFICLLKKISCCFLYSNLHSAIKLKITTMVLITKSANKSDINLDKKNFDCIKLIIFRLIKGTKAPSKDIAAQRMRI